MEESDARSSVPPPGQSELEAAADRAALAAILDARGRQAEAGEALQQAVAMLEKILGPDHYEVGVTLERLAALLATSGALKEAGALYDRTVPIYERTLGRAHPRTVACRANRDEARAIPDP